MGTFWQHERAAASFVKTIWSQYTRLDYADSFIFVYEKRLIRFATSSHFLFSPFPSITVHHVCIIFIPATQCDLKAVETPIVYHTYIKLLSQYKPIKVHFMTRTVQYVLG